MKKTRSRKRLWIQAIAGVCVLAIFGGLGWFVGSPYFADLVRRKVVETIEDATGGRVEMASFQWNLRRLSFEAKDLTVHGLEPPGQLPYAHVNSVLIRLHIISFLERQVSLRSLVLEHPVIHVIVNADGTTNAPEPKVKIESNKSAAQELFDLAIARADLHDGMLLLNERKLPLDFAADDLAAKMTYDSIARRYDGSVEVGKMDLKYAGFRDVPATADVAFSLWTNAIQLRNLALTSQKSTLTANGKLTDFQQPRIEATYESSLDVAQVGAVIRDPQLRGGTVQLAGSGNWSEAAGPALNGHAAIRELDYVDSGVLLRKANLDSNFTLANNRVQLSQIAARLLGGIVTGDADIRNVIESEATKPVPVLSVPKSKAGRRVPPPTANTSQQEGTARLRVSGLSLNEVARLFSTRSMPLNRLNPVGRVGGSVNLAWKQSVGNTMADLALEVAAPGRVADNQLPINGNMRGRYNAVSGRTDLTALNLATPHTQLNASGSLGSTTVALALKANTTSLTEFQPLLTAMGGAPLPVELGGNASFAGTVNGRWSAPQIAGHLEARDFNYIYTPAPKAERVQPVSTQSESKHRSWLHPKGAPVPPPQPPTVAPRRIHIDQFSGDVQYSQSEVALHKAVIQEGGAQLNLDGAAALIRGNFTDVSQFHVQATVHDADIAALQHAAGTDYPLGGKLNFAVHAAGTLTDPHGQGHVSLTDAEAQGRPIKSFTSKINFANHEAELNDIRLQAAHGTVAGSAAYNFHSEEGKLDLTGQSIDLADIPEIQLQRLQTAGVANFTVKGSGTLQHPVLNGHVEIASLTINGDRVGNLDADAVTQGRKLTLTARSKFPKATFTLDGNVDLEGDMPGSARLKFANLDLNPFLPGTVRNDVTQHAALDGEADVSGPFKKPELLQGGLHIQQFTVEVQHIALKSEGPIELTLADETLSVQRCTLISEDTHFTLTGTASFKGDRPLDLQANGSLNLKLAETLDPEVTSYGVSIINVKVDGTMADPRIVGRIEVQHAGLSTIDLPLGFGDINGTLAFNEDRLELQNVSGRMGGGYVNIGGFVTYGRALGFNLTMDGKDIRFRYSGISVTSDQTLHLTGTLQSATVTGNITVTRFAQIPSADLSSLFASASAPTRIPNPKSPLNNLHLEVRILSTPELTVQTSLAKLSGDVDLRLRGTAANPVLLGRANIAEGDIKLAGTKYHLERGDITFIDPVRIDPVLDVEATTRVRDYDITIGLHGTLERLNTTYRSDPPLSSDDIISLLAFGKTQTENAMGGVPSSSGLGQGASGALLSAALNQTLTNRVSKIFGSSSIRINPSVGGVENDPNARLTIEQQVSNNITLTYITNLARSAQEVIQFEYNINSEYTLEGMRDENGVVSFDLLIRKRKK
ncbi:MAG TPA: translocation/assembly module TamB domain-containing protein [Terriglobales bacterium]